MSEMVERVAAVLRRYPVRDLANPGSELDDLRLVEAARAVIAAMRKPVGDMIPIVNRMGNGANIWRDAIDEALK